MNSSPKSKPRNFSDDEIEAFLPQWLETAERVKIDDDTLIYALDTYIPQNWDIKYLGVRKMMGAYLRELNDIVHTPEMKAKGVKILYGILPAIANYYYAAKNAGGEGIFIFNHSGIGHNGLSCQTLRTLRKPVNNSPCPILLPWL